MSRKHLVAIAAAFNQTRPDESSETEYAQWARDVSSVADALQESNPRFNRQRFLFACAGEK